MTVTSYPYLAIAQQFNEDYGDVLSYSDLLEGLHQEPTVIAGVVQPIPYWQNLAMDRLGARAKQAVAEHLGRVHD
jgi:hypothetical protein